MSSSSLPWPLRRQAKKGRKNEEDTRLEELGVTPQLLDFVKGFTVDTFKKHPLQDDPMAGGDLSKDLSEWQERHAILILSKSKEISRIRYALCPRFLKDNQFWRIYFLLVKNFVFRYEICAIQKAKLKKDMDKKNSSDNTEIEVEMTESKLACCSEVGLHANGNADEETGNWLTGDYTDKFVHLVLGSTPFSVADKYVNAIKNASPKTIQQFNSLCIIAAATNKRAICEVIAKEKMKDCLDFLASNWAIRGEVNFTALNMIGDCCLTTNHLKDNEMAKAYRTRLNGNSIWETDLDKSKLSEAQKKIIAEKLARTSYSDARAAGERMLGAAYHAIHGPPVMTDSADETVRVEEDTRKRKAVAAAAEAGDEVECIGNILLRSCLRRLSKSL